MVWKLVNIVLSQVRLTLIFIISYFRFIILFFLFNFFFFFVTMVWLLAHIVPPQGWLFLAEEHTSPTTYAAINFAMHSKWTQRRFCIENTCYIFFFTGAGARRAPVWYNLSIYQVARETSNMPIYNLKQHCDFQDRDLVKQTLPYRLCP